MKFTNSQKIWLLSNLRQSFKQDPYLKYLDSEVLLQQLKKNLKDSKDFDIIKKSLPKEYFYSYEFYRKKGKKFIYPSIVTQIETLFECWDEILAIKKIQDPEFGMFMSGLDEDEEEDDENVEEKPSSLRRCSFGQSPNSFSHYRLNSEASLKIHIRSRVSFVKRNFTKEYIKFKKKIVSTCHEICSRGKAAAVVQKDIKSFFHCIKTSDVETLLKKRYPKKSKKLTSAIARVRQEIGTEELPIGWILSGVISDIVLVVVQEELRKQTDQTCHYINYVDDFVIVKEIDEIDLVDTENSSLTKPCFDLLEKIFKDLLVNSTIEFHKTGEKNRTWRLNQETLGVVDMSWFDFGDASVESDETSRWTAVNEFLLPADNDLDLNERIQFLENLKSIKRKVLNDEIRTWDHFSDYFKKIIFKLSRTGARYIPSIVDTLMIFTRSNNFSEQECIDRLDELYQTIKKHDPNMSTWLALFGSLRKYGDRKELCTWIVARCRDVADFQAENNRFDDYYLAHSWLSAFQSSFLEKVQDASGTVKFSQVPFFYVESKHLVDFIKSIESEKVIKKTTFKNEFLITNSLLKLHRKVKSPDELMGYLLYIKKEGGVELFSKFILEGLYYFSESLTFDNLEKIIELIKPFSSSSMETLQAEKLLSYVCDSREDAMRYVYEMSPVHKVESYRAFLKQIYSPQKSTPSYIKWISEDDDILVGSKEMTVLFLHLSATVDHWKKVLLYKSSTFDNSNYISSWVFPDIYPELGLIFFAIAKSILKLKVPSVLLAKCDSGIPLIIKKKMERLSKISMEEGVFKLSIDHVLNYDVKNNIDNTFITVGHVDFDIDKDYTPENSYGHSLGTAVELSKRVNQCLNQAIKTRSTFLVFPELCVPRSELRSLLEKAGQHGITVIAGIEARSDSEKMYRNTTVISIPIKKQVSPMGKPYLAFFQYKNFPAAVEDYLLTKKGYHYVKGQAIYWFVSKKLGSFSVLTCFDFLATKLKASLKTKIQLLFVPAVNHDNSTYNVVAESCIREMFCCCVICNNSRKGASLVMMPFKEPHARLVLSSHGLSLPGFSTIKVNIESIEKMQDLTPRSVECARHDTLDSNHELVKKFKQLPPDWLKK